MSPEPMIIAESVAALREARQNLPGPVGLVPTMGAVHEGHLALLRRARAENAAVVISIFVNPTQFAPHEDLARYPRPRQRDLELAQREGVDLAFVPPVEEVYPPGFATYVEVEGLAQRWEGERRPGHFRGVATVVHRLFLLVRPHRAYFGEKDYQQLLVVLRLATDLPVLPLGVLTPGPSSREGEGPGGAVPPLPAWERGSGGEGPSPQIVACPTVREPDGLALSSRNAYLSPEERRRAVALWRALRHAQELLRQGVCSGSELEGAMADVMKSAGVRVDYAAVVDPHTLERLPVVEQESRALVAAYVGSVRLIDNASLLPLHA